MFPIYKYITNEDHKGMDFIALVDSPAHMKTWSAFSKDGKTVSKVNSFEFKQYFNEEKRIIMGVAIATEVPIYRNDKELGEHYAVFTASETDKIWERMMASNFMHNVNEMHEESKKVNDIFLKHSYAIDYKKGIVPPTEFENQNLKDGSIIAFYKVNSDEAWAKVKSGEFKGFSIEGYFDRQELKINKTNMKKEEKGTILEELKALFSKHEAKNVFAEATTVDGVTVYWEGELAEGIELKIKGEDGTELLAPEGMHAIAMEDGNVQVITVDGNGIIQAITVEEAEAPEEDGGETELDIDAIKALIEGFATTIGAKHSKEMKALEDKFSKQNKEITTFVESILDKDDKKKFTKSPLKSFMDL